MNLGEIGKKGEDMTVAFLRKQGCAIIKRNYLCRFGELDIIAQKDNMLLFVEVKTRKVKSIVSPKEAVDKRKVEKITLSAEDFLSKAEGVSHLQPRFDIAEVRYNIKMGEFYLNYHKNAF